MIQQKGAGRVRETFLPELLYDQGADLLHLTLIRNLLAF